MSSPARSRVQKTLQASGAYTAAGLAIWGAVDLAVDAFSLSSHMLRIVMLASAAGLPLVVATCWIISVRQEQTESSDLVRGISAQLSGVIAGSIIAALVFFALLLTNQPIGLPVSANGTTDLTKRAAIAIMPFENLSDDGSNEHFAIGIADGIVTNLQSWGAFPVIGRSATEPYRGRSPDLMSVASTLKVRYLLTGSVVAARDAIRVTAQLVDGSDHSIVRAIGPYDRPRLDIFDIQDEISEAIVTAIVPTLVRREMRPASLDRPAELASWELVMRAQGLTLKGTYDAAREAEDLLRIAIQREVEYAAAYARLAELEHNFSSTNYAKVIGDEAASQALTSALNNARMAVDLSPSLVDARIWYGHLLLHHRKVERGVEQLQEAVRLSPSHGQAHAELGFAYALSGSLDEAFREFDLSSKLSPNDPRSVRIQTFEAFGYLYAGKNQEALLAAQSVLESARGTAQSFYPYLIEISALVRLGQLEEAREQANEFREQLGELDWSAVKRGAWSDQQLSLVRADLETIGVLPVEGQSDSL